MHKLNNTCKKNPNRINLLKTELYARRKAMGISQYVLADKISLSRNCIQQMECYEHLPKTETVFDMMQALGFDEKESKEFLEKYLNAYYQDKAFQKDLDKGMAGII